MLDSSKGVSLLEIWLATRGIPVGAIAEGAKLSRNTCYQLIAHTTGARPTTLAAVASAMAGASGEKVTPEHVAALARGRVQNPSRVSDEIHEALAAAAQEAQ